MNSPCGWSRSANDPADGTRLRSHCSKLVVLAGCVGSLTLQISVETLQCAQSRERRGWQMRNAGVTAHPWWSSGQQPRPNALDLGSIPAWGTRFHMPQPHTGTAKEIFLLKSAGMKTLFM